MQVKFGPDEAFYLLNRKGDKLRTINIKNMETLVVDVTQVSMMSIFTLRQNKLECLSFNPDVLFASKVLRLTIRYPLSLNSKYEIRLKKSLRVTNTPAYFLTRVRE